MARALGAHVVSVRHRRIAAARNAAARAARGDLLVFVDADTLVTEAAVRAAVLAMRRGAAAGAAPSGSTAVSPSMDASSSR